METTQSQQISGWDGPGAGAGCVGGRMSAG